MTENELLDELAALLTIPPIEPDEVTARMLAEKTGCSERSALDNLKKLEAGGKLTSRLVKQGNGRSALAFRKAGL